MSGPRHLPADVYGLRSIALLEWLKGAGALTAGILLALHPHASFGRIAERILQALHIHRDSAFALEIIGWARRIDVRDIHIVLVFIAVYVALRAAEGYGLWRVRRWAEWLGVINGAIYLPVEIMELVKHANLLKSAILLINIAVVWYLAWELKKGRQTMDLDRGWRWRESPSPPVHGSNL
jgi:uncharacterized membrane protein (DUF2068 family)